MPTSTPTQAVDEDASAEMPADDDETGNEDAPSSVTTVPSPSAGGLQRLRAAATRAVIFGILPAVALLLASGGAWLKWWEAGSRGTQAASAESVRAATESTIRLLSYQPDTVEKDLAGARDRLTGAFRDSYTRLTNDVVIPGAKQKHISAVATVPAAATVSATKNRAVVLIMVNQTTTVGTDAPTQTDSCIRVTLDKVAGQWLVSDFTPI